MFTSHPTTSSAYPVSKRHSLQIHSPFKSITCLLSANMLDLPFFVLSELGFKRKATKCSGSENRLCSLIASFELQLWYLLVLWPWIKYFASGSPFPHLWDGESDSSYWPPEDVLGIEEVDLGRALRRVPGILSKHYIKCQLLLCKLRS